MSDIYFAEIKRIVGITASSPHLDLGEEHFTLWRDAGLSEVTSLSADPLTTLLPGQTERYGSVSCFLSLQAYFGTEESASRLLRDVYRLLRPGGCFFGVVPDGRHVSACKDRRVPSCQTDRNPFGSVATVDDPDTSHNLIHGYLVFSSVLRKLAEACNLQPVLVAPLSSYARLTRAAQMQLEFYTLFAFRKREVVPGEKIAK